MSKDRNTISDGDVAPLAPAKVSRNNILVTQEGLLPGCMPTHETMEAESPSTDSCKHLQQRLEKLSDELKTREAALAEAHATVKVLLRQRELDRQEFKEAISGAIHEQIQPFLDKLKKRKLGTEEKSLLAVVQQNLDQLFTPLSRMPVEPGRLSPTEIQVIHLIRQGKTSKDIAVLMGVAQSTIDFHRHNIRRKLRLSNTRQNLRSYLSTVGYQDT
jgi:DNA-binding CsgD family transcriptional regulator